MLIRLKAAAALFSGVYEAYALLTRKPTVTDYVRKCHKHRFGRPAVYFAIGWWAAHFLATVEAALTDPAD